MTGSRALLLAASVGLVHCSRAPEGRFGPEGRVAAIERRLGAMRVDTVTVMGLTTEGGDLVAHSEHDALRRLFARWLGEMGQTHQRFYFDDRGLFFVQEIEVAYGSPLGYDSSNSGAVVRAETTTTTWDSRAAHGWQSSGPARRPSTPAEAAGRARRLRAWADSLVQMLHKPSPYWAR